MSTAEPLGVLLDDIATLASNVHETCIHSSSGFDTIKRDVFRLPAILRVLAEDLSKPESIIQDLGEVQLEQIASIIKSYRPYLLQVEKYAKGDQSHKKKRIWGRDKDRLTPALDVIHRQLELLNDSLRTHVSYLESRQLALMQNKLGALVEEFKSTGLGSSHPLQAGDQQFDADAQWSMLRRKLVEDGITDLDIEAHTSSIRALLQEKLPSYYDIHARSGSVEAEEFAKPSAGSSDTMLRTTSQPEHRSLGLGDKHKEIKPSQCVRPRISSSLSPRSAPLIGGEFNHGPISTQDEEIRLPRSDSADLSSKLNKAHAIFSVGDSTDSESEVLHHEDIDTGHVDVMRRLPSTASRNNSVHRVRSDMSEYDTQGNLRKRTITTSYTSLPDVAAGPWQRLHSSPGPQSHELNTGPARVPAARSARRTISSADPAHSPNSRDLSCPYCSRLRGFRTPADLTMHLYTNHSDLFVPAPRARKYEKLKQAYGKRTRQLQQALQLLASSGVGPPWNGDEHSSTTIGPDWMTETLRDLDVDHQHSDSEDDSRDFNANQQTSSKRRFAARRRCSDEDSDESSSLTRPR